MNSAPNFLWYWFYLQNTHPRNNLWEEELPWEQKREREWERGWESEGERRVRDKVNDLAYYLPFPSHTFIFLLSVFPNVFLLLPVASRHVCIIEKKAYNNVRLYVVKMMTGLNLLLCGRPVTNASNFIVDISNSLSLTNSKMTNILFATGLFALFNYSYKVNCM